jgi:hypothetical protein
MTPQNTATLNFDSSTGRPVDHILIRQQHQQRTNRVPQNAEEELSNRIFLEGNGKGLIRFCRELSLVLIRQYSQENDATELRSKLTNSLMATLHCTEIQAVSLVELSLELIHAKVHGAYRRSSVELSYLIAMATGAVSDVSSN